MASFDLPEHLQGLNTLAPSPPVARDDDQEFWAYLHADDLFKNFGTNEAYQPKPEAATVPPPTPVDKRDAAPSLSDFIAKFVSDPNAGMPAEPTAGLPYPFNVNYSPAVASSSAPTPRTPLSAGLAGINTADIIPRPEPIEEDDDESEERITGAKRLKQLGADTATIQEDKRRRNTEASARFRAKKKEREQAVEQQNSVFLGSQTGVLG